MSKQSICTNHDTSCLLATSRRRRCVETTAMQELDDSVPSLLMLLEATPEAPLFCFREAVMGSVHECSLLPREDTTQVGERPLSDCSREGDVPITNQQLKSFILSSTPLRKISSPRNLVLDSDAEGGWSFSMATPACIREGVKETPLQSTTDEDNSTLLESATEKSMLDRTKESSNYCEKLCNRVVLRPGEKPLARTLFPRDPTPNTIDDDCPGEYLPGTPILQRHTPLPHVQRIHNRFEHCMFSPILASPLVSSQQHKNSTATHTKMDTDCSVVSVSLFGGLDSPCGAKQDAGPNDSIEGMPFAEEEEDALVSCSQELFGSPEVCSTTVTVRGEGKDREVGDNEGNSQVKLEDGQRCLETEASSQQQLSDSQKTSRGFRNSQPETPKAQRCLPQRNQLAHPLLCEKGTRSSSSLYIDKFAQDYTSPHVPPSTTSRQDTPKHHSELLCNPAQSQHSNDRKPDCSLDRSDVLDLLFMSCSQLDAHMSNQEDKASILPPPPSLPKLSVLPYLPPHTSAKLPISPPPTESRRPCTPPENIYIAATSAIDNTEDFSSSHAVTGTVRSIQDAGGPTPVRSVSRTPPGPATPGEASQMGHVYTCDGSGDTLRQWLTTGASVCNVAMELKGIHARGSETRKLQEGQRPLAVAPQAKRRRLSTNVFQYPSSVQLRGNRKGRKYGSSTDGEDSHSCTPGNNTSLNIHVSENTPQVLSVPRRRKSGMVSNTKHPAKRVCHEDPVGAEGRKVEGLDGKDQIVATDTVTDDMIESCGKKLLTSNQVDSKVSTRCEVLSDRADLLAAESLKNSASRSECKVSQLPDPVCSASASHTVSDPEGQSMSVSSLAFGTNSTLVAQTSDLTDDSPKRSKVEPAFKTTGSPILSQQQQQQQQQHQQQQQQQQQNNTITVISTASTRGTRAPGLRRAGKKWHQKSQATATAKPASGLPVVTAAGLSQPEPVDSVAVEDPHTGPAEGILDVRNATPFQRKISPKPAILEDPGAHNSKLQQADFITAETLLAEDFPELDINTFTKAAADPEIQTETTPSKPQEPSLDKCFAEITPVPHNPATRSDTPLSGTFTGFKTASGRVVHVSDQAMCRAQKLITEELRGGSSDTQDGLESVTTPLPRKQIAADTPPASCFKTPRLVRSGGKLTTQSAFKPLQRGAETPTGSTAVPPRNALSTGRKVTTRSFRAPRKMSSVSKEEEAASLARIMRKFGSVSASSVQPHPTKLVKGKCGGGGGGGPEGGRGTAHNMVESGFATARGQKLSVSVSSIQRGQQIISDEKENGMESSVSPQTSHPQSSNQLMITATGKSESRTSELTHQHVPISGFTTASGRKLTVSATALERAHSILGVVGQDEGTGITAEVACDGRAVRKEIGTVHVGFQTASGKNLSVSAESLARAESIVAFEPDDDSSTKVETDIHNRMTLTGFQTAGGKGIAVSANNLETAQRVLQEGEMDVSDQTIIERQPDAILAAKFQMFKGKTVSRKAQPSQSAQSLAKRDRLSYSHEQMANTLVTGFQTGSGRTVSVSMSSLQQPQNMIGSELPVVAEHSESRMGKITPNLVEGLHADGVSTGDQCPALSAEDLDDFDVDNLGAFTQIDFHSSEHPKGQCQELVNCSQSGESPNPKDGSNSTAGTQDTWNRPDDGFLQERGYQAGLKEATSSSDCITSRVEAECLANNMDRTVSVDEQLLQSLTLTTVGADDTRVPDPDGDHSSYFSTQMVRQFLDFSSDEEEQGNRSPTEQHRRQEVDINMSSAQSENTNCVTSQLVPPPSLVQRGEGQGEDSQTMRSPCLHQETMSLVKTHLPPLGHGSSIVNSQGEQGVQCHHGDPNVRATLDAVSMAVDELFEVGPDYEPSSISAVAGIDPDCNRLQPTHELLTSLPSLDPHDLQPSSNTPLKDVLSPIRSSSSFCTPLASRDAGKMEHGSPQGSIQTGSAPAECGQQVLWSTPTLECKEPVQTDAGLTRLIDSSSERRQFAMLSRQQSPTDHHLHGPFNPLLKSQRIGAELSQQTLCDTLQPSTTIAAPAEVPYANTPAQGTNEPGNASITHLSANVNSLQANGDLSLLNEVLTESMVDSLGEVMDMSALERSSVGCHGGVAVGTGMGGREEHAKLSMEPLPKQGLSPPRMYTPTGTQPIQSPLTNVCRQLQSPHIDGPLQTSPLLQTAAGKQINLADKQLGRCQSSEVAGLSSPINVLTEDVSVHNTNALVQPILMGSSQTSGRRTANLSEKVLSHARPVLVEGGKAEQTMPTSTSLVTSELLRGKDADPAADEEEVCGGFQTASGHVDEASIPGSTVTWRENTISGFAKEGLHDRFPGLQTASGNRVEISERSLQAARRTLQGVDPSGGTQSTLIEVTPCQGFPGLQTASGNRVEISEQSLQAARRTLQGVDPSGGTQSTLIEVTPCQGFPGLQTASGNRVEISEQSLQAARRTLQGVDPSGGTQSALIEVTPCHSFPGLQTASGNIVEISEQSLQAARRTLQGVDPSGGTQSALVEVTPCRSFPGLQTACGNRVEISEQSLQAARRTLQGVDPPGGTQSPLIEVTPCHSFPGLQTASGKGVEISEASLRAARMVIHEEQVGSSLSSSKSPHLMAAKRDQVNVCKDALPAVISTLTLDPDLHDTPNRTFPGLHTASGAEVNISSAALLAAKCVLHSTPGLNPLPPVTPKHDPIPGLQTASGNQVSISEQSLAAVRKTFGGNQPWSSTTFPVGLTTASGSSVPISKSALEAVKQVIGSEGAIPSNIKSDDIPHSTVGTLTCESSGAGQLSVSPATTQQTHTGATASCDRYQPVFHSSEMVVKPQHANTATPGPQTEGRYIPVFNSEGRPGGHHHKPAPPQLHLTQPCPSRSRPHTSHIHNVKGVTSTPEALLYDRSSQSKPLLPMQTYLNQDGSYVDATPTRRYPHSVQPGHLIANQSQSSLNTLPNPRSSTPRPPHFSTHTTRPPLSHSSTPPTRQPLFHSSTPAARPPLFHSSTSTTTQSLSLSSTPSTRPPLSHSHFLRSSYGTGKSRAPQSNHSFPYPQNSHTSRSSTAEQMGFASGFATPRRPVGPAHVRTPVWGTSLARDTNRAGTSAASGWKHSCQPGAQCYRPASSEQSPVRPFDKGQTPPFCQLTVSTPSSHPPNTESSIYTTGSTTIVSPHSSDSTPIRATSTQNAERDRTEHGTPHCTLSPINITLSQLCALDNSQFDAETIAGGMGDTKVKEGGGREDDSGYQSKNQTETTGSKSPVSNFAPDVHCSSRSTKTDSGSTLTASVQAYEDEECAVFAEIATELLDDSLEVFSEGEGDARTLGERTSHSKQKTPDETPCVANIRPCPPSTASNSDHTNPRVTCKPGVRSEASVGLRPLNTTAHVDPQTSGPIRPQIGSLLAARLHLSSHRVPLTLAVGNTTPGGHGHSPRELHSLRIHPAVLRMSVNNALEFSFSGSHYFSSAVLNGAVVCVGDGGLLRLADGRAGVREFWEAFSQSPGVDPKLISFEWFANHYRWVVWKLASLEVAFPQQFAGRCLTPDWLMLQLKYRYDREIDRAERSALHKISEQDDLPSRTMVVCVSAIHTDRLSSLVNCNESVVNNSSIISKDDSRVGSPPPNPPCIEVTDGWYSVPAVLDMPLKRMVQCGKISLGTKLMTYGSELIGGCDPSHPLESSPAMALRLHANSTRRARWFSKLGYQRVPHPFPVTLSSVFPDGGLVGCVDVVVARVYPLLCMEKVEGRRNVFRNERAESRVGARHEAVRQREVDRICARVQREFEEEVEAEESGHVASRRRSRRRLNTSRVKQLDDGEDIYTALMNAPDPPALLELLTPTQHTFLESYRLSLQSQRQSELEKRVRQAIEEAEDELPPPRNVVPLLRARLVPFGPHPPPDCQLSAWRPGEAVRGVLREGKVLRMFNINATPSRYKSSWQIQLTASRSTRYEEIPASHDQLSRSYNARKCTAIATVSNAKLPWGEFDTVGIVVCITSANLPGSDESEHHLSSVYLADGGGALLVVKVWNGLKARALEDLVIPGALVAVSNLSYRGLGHTHHLPTANAGDTCVFSQHPQEHHLKSALEVVSRELPAERKEYLQSLEESITCTASYF